MRSPRSLRLIACSLALACLPALADDVVKPDMRVTDALDSEDMKYTVQDNGEVSVTIQWNEDGRSQGVRVQSKTFSWKQNEFRDVYSIAFKTDGSKLVEQALANRLLDESNSSTLGLWGKQDDTVYSIVRVPAKATPSQLHEAISFAAEKADEMEKEILGTDEY
jgi:hypothetical protein